mgnify:CR=1 FL=1
MCFLVPFYPFFTICWGLRLTFELFMIVIYTFYALFTILYIQINSDAVFVIKLQSETHCLTFYDAYSPLMPKKGFKCPFKPLFKCKGFYLAMCRKPSIKTQKSRRSKPLRPFHLVCFISSVLNYSVTVIVKRHVSVIADHALPRHSTAHVAVPAVANL